MNTCTHTKADSKFNQWNIATSITNDNARRTTDNFTCITAFPPICQPMFETHTPRCKSETFSETMKIMGSPLPLN